MTIYCLHLAGIPYKFTIDSDLHDKYVLCNPGILPATILHNRLGGGLYRS